MAENLHTSLTSLAVGGTLLPLERQQKQCREKAIVCDGTATREMSLSKVMCAMSTEIKVDICDFE